MYRYTFSGIRYRIDFPFLILLRISVADISIAGTSTNLATSANWVPTVFTSTGLLITTNEALSHIRSGYFQLPNSPKLSAPINKNSRASGNVLWNDSSQYRNMQMPCLFLLRGAPSLGGQMQEPLLPFFYAVICRKEWNIPCPMKAMTARAQRRSNVPGAEDWTFRRKCRFFSVVYLSSIIPFSCRRP